MELQDNLQPKFVPDQDLVLMDQFQHILCHHPYAYHTGRSYFDRWALFA